MLNLCEEVDHLAANMFQRETNCVFKKASGQCSHCNQELPSHLLDVST